MSMAFLRESQDDKFSLCSNIQKIQEPDFCRGLLMDIISCEENMCNPHMFNRVIIALANAEFFV
jgi:hypothetical protein